jgi:hypothetical protein
MTRDKKVARRAWDWSDKQQLRERAKDAAGLAIGFAMTSEDSSRLFADKSRVFEIHWTLGEESISRVCLDAEYTAHPS